jgi:hypothetical protein
MASVVFGTFLVLVALVLLGAGGTALWADRTQREAGFVTTGVHTFSTSGSALVTEPVDLGSGWSGWLYSPTLLGKVRIRVTPTEPGSRLFVGIGRSADVDRYLAGVERTVITDFWRSKTDAVGGGKPEAPPGAQGFWVASTVGSGPQTLRWAPVDGSWTVVVMNATAGPGIHVDTDLGARLAAVLWVAIGLLVTGLALLAGVALLIVAAVRRRRASRLQPQ